MGTEYKVIHACETFVIRLSSLGIILHAVKDGKEIAPLAYVNGINYLILEPVTKVKLSEASL